MVDGSRIGARTRVSKTRPDNFARRKTAPHLVNSHFDELTRAFAFDLRALLLVTSAGLAYLNYRVLKLPLTERVTARQRARCEVRSLLRSFIVVPRCCDDGECDDHVDTRNRHQSRNVFVRKS